MKTTVALGFKGGTGKTTVTLHLGAALANFHDKRVLLIDFDPQANLSQGLGFNPDSKDTMVPVLQKYKKIKDVICKTKVDGLSLIRANTFLDQVENSQELCNDSLSVLRLKRALEEIAGEFDFCFIDVPPSLGWLCKAATFASDFIIVNSVPEPYSVLAMSRLEQYIQRIKDDKEITLLGIVLSKWNTRTLLSKDSVDTLGTSFTEGLFKTKIRTDMSVNNAILAGEPVFKYDPEGRAAEDFKDLAKEFLEKINAISGGVYGEACESSRTR